MVLKQYGIAETILLVSLREERNLGVNSPTKNRGMISLVLHGDETPTNKEHYVPNKIVSDKCIRTRKQRCLSPIFLIIIFYQ